MASDQQARVAVITGASSGIGKAAAKALAAQGWRVIGVGRDPGRCAAAEAEIRAAATPGAQVEMLISDTARLARDIAARTPRINALLNNAGGVTRELILTPEGNEMTFASNHLGHFLLTTRLLPQLRAAAAGSPGAARVISVSSDAHEYSAGFDWNDLQLIGNYSVGATYMNVKLANILFTRTLAKRVAADGIVVHAIHPGLVDSNFASYGDEAFKGRMAERMHLAISPEQGADTMIWLAVSPEGGQSSGGYYHKRTLTAPSALARDEDAAERLWLESEKLVGRAGV